MVRELGALDDSFAYSPISSSTLDSSSNNLACSTSCVIESYLDRIDTLIQEDTVAIVIRIVLALRKRAREREADCQLIKRSLDVRLLSDHLGR